MVLRNPRWGHPSRTAAASKTFKTSESDDIAKPSHSVASRNSSFRRLAKEFRISTGWGPIIRGTLNSGFSPRAIKKLGGEFRRDVYTRDQRYAGRVF